MIPNNKLQDYLESWLCNVGRSCDVDQTLADAMSDDQSLINWGFKESRFDDIEYDYEFAIEILEGR